MQWWTTTSLYSQTSLSRPPQDWEQNFWDTQGSRYQGKNSIFKNGFGLSHQFNIFLVFEIYGSSTAMNKISL